MCCSPRRRSSTFLRCTRPERDGGGAAGVLAYSHREHRGRHDQPRSPSRSRPTISYRSRRSHSAWTSSAGCTSPSSSCCFCPSAACSRFGRCGSEAGGTSRDRRPLLRWDERADRVRRTGDWLAGGAALRVQTVWGGAGDRAGRNPLTATTPSHTNSASTRTCVRAKGGSDWVGASRNSTGIRLNSCATSTKTFK